MDMSKYYEDFRFTYNLAIVALCLTFLVVVFVGIRSLKDKKESIKIKVLNWVLLIIIFVSVLTYFFIGPYQAKKDIDNNTIYCYEGEFEIIEVSHGIYYRATFLFNGQEITLKYSKDEQEYDYLKPGKYNGTLVYAQNVSQILYLEMQWNWLYKDL